MAVRHAHRIGSAAFLATALLTSCSAPNGDTTVNCDATAKGKRGAGDDAPVPTWSRALECELDAFLPADEHSRRASMTQSPRLVVKILRDGPTETQPRIRWEVGGKPLGTLDEVLEELQRIKEAPDSQVPALDNPAARKLIPCEIVAGPGTAYEHVAKTSDAANAAGFRDVRFVGDPGGAR